MAKETEETKKTISVKKTKTKNGWKVAKKLVVLLLIAGLAGLAGYFYMQYQNQKNLPGDEAEEQANSRIVKSIDEIFLLPKDEEPSIGKLYKDKLTENEKAQDFFQKVEDGDYVLVYNKSKLAILYRPSINKVVDSRPFTVQENSLSVAVIGAETARNAADTALKAAFKNEITVVAKTDAKNAYTGVTVVDLSGKYAEQTKKIASTLKGKVGTLPEGEAKPTGADIVVIVGAPQEAAPAQ